MPVYGGLDLSEVADLTALVLIGQPDGTWHVNPTFWLPAEGSPRRGRIGAVRHVAQRGFFKPRRAHRSNTSTSPASAHVFKRYNIRKIGFDSWNLQHLKPWLLKAGISEH